MATLFDQIKATKRDTTLGEIVTLHRGYDLPLAQIKPGKYPVVFSNGRREYHNEYKVKGPGVFTGRSGSLGGIFFVGEDFWPHNTTLYVSDFHGNNPKYCYYFLSSFDFAKYNAGTGVPTLNRNHVHDIPVKVPNRNTQDKIAEVLSVYDEKIENNKSIIKSMEMIAQTIFNEWFVNFRFPGYEKTKFIDSEIGEIPEGWKIGTLDMVSQINSESIKQWDVNKTINYIDIASVSTGKIDTVQPILFSEAPGRARRVVRHGDIIWSTVRPNRRSYSLIINPEEDLIVSTGFAVIRPTRISYPYIYQTLTSDSFVGYLVNRARGSAYPAVTGIDFEKAPILIPDQKLLDSFDEMATPLHEYIEALSQENKNLSKIRDLLIPQLFKVTRY